MKNEKGYNEEKLKKVRFLSNKTIKEINDWFNSDMPTKEELEKMIKEKKEQKDE